MKRISWVLLSLFAAAAGRAQTVYDASQFGKSDICLSIQAAIAALPATPSSLANAGMVIDARNFKPTNSTTNTLSCTVNPFTLGTNTNPLVLANMGATGSSNPGSVGGVVLLPGYIISTDVPWIVPSNWSIVGEGGRVTILAPSSTFVANLAAYSSLTVNGAGGGSNYTVTASSSSIGWTNNMVGMVFTACSFAVCASSTTSYTNATVVGIVTEISLGSTTTLNLGSPLQATLSSGARYTLQAPLIEWATSAPCTPGTNCSGQITNSTNTGGTVGSLIQDIGLDCTQNAGGGTPVSGCIPFWDQYGQERSMLTRLRIAEFAGPGIAVFTGSAQNGGPFTDIQMSAGTSTVGLATGSACVEIGGTGVGGEPTMRGIRGLTCTASNNTPGASGYGVDINTQAFSIENAHFEDFGVGVEVGFINSSRGIKISGITGGATGKDVAVVVDISATCQTGTVPCASFGTGDVDVSNVYTGGSTTAVTFKDEISGNTASEALLGFYNLGDCAGSCTTNTRLVATTSSTASVKSSFNLSSFQLGGVTVNGVQGTAGNLQLSSASGPAVGDAPKYDASGNITDSGLVTQNSVLFGWCDGTVGTANATIYFLAPFNGANVGCATTTGVSVPVPFPCTAKNLYATAAAGGAVATSGVITVYKNGSPTSLACTLGTGVTCNDPTDTVSFVAGNTYEIAVKTGAANDTTNGPRAAFQCQ